MSHNDTRGRGPHILVVPYPAPGHMLPLLDLTHQLAKRNLTITVLVTPKLVSLLEPLLSANPLTVQTLVLPFPSHPSIPAGVENMQELPIIHTLQISSVLAKLQEPLFRWFSSHPSPPIAIVSDLFLGSWTYPLAQNLGIHRYGFAPFNAHSMCVLWGQYVEPGTLPPVLLEMFLTTPSSRGLICNSFAELERESLEIFKKKYLRHDRLWAVGPHLPIKDDPLGTTKRGGHSSIPPAKVKEWLDSCKDDNSVVYIGFGSQITLSKTQMEAIAKGVEESGVRFIWYVKDPLKEADMAEEEQNVLPSGFEERMAGRGLVIRGWAPQIMILNHKAVGTYFSHCGWNSALEGLLAKVLLLVWPMQADHYHNAKMFVEELEIAIQVCEGLKTVPDHVKLARILADSVTQTQPERVRTMELSKKAIDAAVEGGSSYNTINELVNEISALNTVHVQSLIAAVPV
uniref:UDP-glucosyltransferase UGT89N1 n=1 Tax=Polygala tenuifolia TaxID=355332 RepID=A0A3G3NBT8_9FABA|nr:UDP-glucosyltransferase UGT89N1 [Polygala tenuifolia]